MPDIECRVAKLEQQHADLIIRIVDMKEDGRRKSDKIFDKLESIDEAIKGIQLKDGMRVGYATGALAVIMTLSALGAWVFNLITQK